MLIYANIKVYEINKKWEDGFVSCITQFKILIHLVYLDRKLIQTSDNRPISITRNY